MLYRGKDIRDENDPPSEKRPGWYYALFVAIAAALIVGIIKLLGV